MSRRVTAAAAASAALAAHDGGPALAVVAVVEGPAELLGARFLLFETGETRGTLGDADLDRRAEARARRALEDEAGPGLEVVETDATRCTLYVEAVRPPDELVVVGAGHIAVPLARLGTLLGFQTTVLDDREEFATPDRFPEEATVVRADFADPFRAVAIGPRSHIVLVTRAHKYDYDCLLRLVADDTMPNYIGMIGSRRRVKAAFHALLEANIPRERLAAIHAPVGLGIGAETPEEIAVSIAAELVRVRRLDYGDDGDGAPGDVDNGHVRRGKACLAPTGARRTPRSLVDRERVVERLLPETDS